MPLLRKLGPFLLLLFSATLCSAMIVPFMGFFLVEGLGREPWTISLYSALAVGLTIAVNRRFAQAIDAGRRVFPLVGLALVGYLAASLALAVMPAFWVVLTLGVVGFGFSSSAVSTIFSLGGSLAERHEIDRTRLNAYMRATSSTAWMVGPALTFQVADRWGEQSVFYFSTAAALLWLLLWWQNLPRDITAAPASPAVPGEAGSNNTALWVATAFVFLLAMAHSLSFHALPLFYVREVGLPGYAPGLAFSIKTFVEVAAILATPALSARFGIRPVLLATTLLAAAALYALASVQSLPQMLGAAALEGFYYGLFASLGISYVQSFAKDRPAAATALYWNTLMVTGILAGPAVGLIAQFTDFQAPLWLALLVALVAFAVLLVGGRAETSAARK